MRIEILENPAAVARRAAAFVAERARAAIAERGRFTLAVSGGQTPWDMLRGLAREDLLWSAVHIFQVDERVAPTGHADRNLTHLTACLGAGEAAAAAAVSIHAMPVEDEDLDAAARRYAEDIAAQAGSPAVLDLVHLGLGADGHTASLVPGDAVLDETARDVAVTGVYEGRRRMTLTYPILDRARAILWLATGGSKAAMLVRLRAGDPTIPAGRVAADRATALIDSAAAAGLGVA